MYGNTREYAFRQLTAGTFHQGTHRNVYILLLHSVFPLHSMDIFSYHNLISSGTGRNFRFIYLTSQNGVFLLSHSFYPLYYGIMMMLQIKLTPIYRGNHINPLITCLDKAVITVYSPALPEADHPCQKVSQHDSRSLISQDYSPHPAADMKLRR